MSILKVNLIDILTTPIIPLGFLIYFICFNLCDTKSFSISFIGVFVSCKLIQYIKQRFETIFQIGFLCTDWFLLDIMSIFTNEALLLKPSILETITRNSVYLII